MRLILLKKLVFVFTFTLTCLAIGCVEPVSKDAKDIGEGGVVSVNSFDRLMNPSGNTANENDFTNVDTAGMDTAGMDTAGMDTAGMDTAGTDTAGMDTAGTDTAGTDTAGTDTAGTDTAGMDTAGMGIGGEPAQEFAGYAIEMLNHVNNFRSIGGRCGNQSFPSAPPLTLHPLLNESSIAHAEDMANNGYFDHNSQDGRTPWDRIAATGYTGSGFGENIAAGRSNALDTFIQWQNSPGHCTNMLRSNYSDLGVGYYYNPNSQYRHYWVQNFSSR